MILTKLLALTLVGVTSWVYSTPTLTPGETKIDPAIVPVMTAGGRGTGFFIDVNGAKFLVTAAHVCGDSKILLSPKGLHRVLVSRPDKDICVATTYQNVAALPIGNEVASGDYVEMTGFPGDLSYDYQKGTAAEVGFSMFKGPDAIAGVCPDLTALSTDGTSCAIFVTTIRLELKARPGNSGGPVQNAAGQVVGIIIATDGQSGYMAPASELVGIINGAP